MTQPQLSPDGEWQWDGEKWIPYAVPQSTAANDAEQNIPDEGEKLTLKERLQAQKTNNETNKKAQLSSVVGELFSQLIEPILEDANKGRELFAVVIDTQDVHLDLRGTGEDTRIPSREIIDFFEGLLKEEDMTYDYYDGCFSGDIFYDEDGGYPEMGLWKDGWDFESDDAFAVITSYLFRVGGCPGSWLCYRLGESHLLSDGQGGYGVSMEHIETMTEPDECRVFFIDI